MAALFRAKRKGVRREAPEMSALMPALASGHRVVRSPGRTVAVVRLLQVGGQDRRLDAALYAQLGQQP